MQKQSTPVSRQRDRGLIFKGETPNGLDGREVGFLVTEYDRAPRPIAWVKVDVFGDEATVAKRVKRARAIAGMLASNHVIRHPEAVPMNDILSERIEEDRRVRMLTTMALLPVSEMPPHFSPFENWQAHYAPGMNFQGPLAWCIWDVESLPFLQIKKPLIESAPASTPASKEDGRGLASTAA